MNKKQLIVLWIGIILVVLMGLFPPWHVKPQSGAQLTIGFSFILIPPQVGKVRAMINTSQLLVQWCIVGFVTLGYLFTYHNKT